MTRNPGRLLLAALLALGLAVPASGAPVRVVASDERGVTLRLAVGAWAPGPAGADGRVQLAGLRDAHVLAEPGRPMLPAWSALVALPPGARPSVRVLSSEGDLARTGLRVAIAGRPVVRPTGDERLGEQPAIEPVEPIVDGTWPPSPVETGPTIAFRGRTLLPIELRPFRADEAAGSVSAPLVLTVRVDFGVSSTAALRGLPAGPDRHVDPALEGRVLNWDQARDWRVAAEAGAGARPAAATAGPIAFEESFPEVRVRLDETALWRLPFDDLAAQGFPEGVPIEQVSVHRHEYLEGANPPYGTIELPCEVDDDNLNGVFDSGDGVVVYTRTWAERSGATTIRRFWGDAEVVYVTRRLGGGLRPTQRAGWNGVNGLTPLATFPSFRHYEKDLAPIMQFVDAVSDTNIGVWHWTDQALYYSRPDTIRIDATDLDTTQTIDVRIRWVGRARDAHYMSSAFRNGLGLVHGITDSLYWYGKSAIIAQRTLPGRALSPNNDNFLRQWGKSSSAAPNPTTNYRNVAGLDWFEVTYPRFFRAKRDYLRFNSASATGNVQFRVTGIVDGSVRVWDVTDPESPVRVVLDPARITGTAGDYTVEFQDVVTPGQRREYVLATVQVPDDHDFGPRLPFANAYSRVTRRSLYAAGSGDYLIVVPEAFLPAVDSLRALRSSQGLSVVVAPFESVCDEFDGGRRTGTAIQRFVRHAYQRWSTRFLLLVGDGTLDPKGARRYSGTDWVPILPSLGPVGSSEGLELIPSDNRYGFLSGNDDPISGFTGIVVPEIMVGRLTVNSLAEARTVLRKIVNYEQVQPTDDWRRSVLLTADDAFSGETTFGGGTVTSGYCHRSYEELFLDYNQRMEDAILGDSGVPGMNVEQFNLRSYLTNERIDLSGFDTCRVDRSETQAHTHNGVTPVLLGKLNSGLLMWNYQGHANEYVLTHEDLWVNSGVASGDDSQRLANTGRPFLFTAFSCHPNMFARPEVQFSTSIGPSLGEDLLALPNGRGAIASWASVCFEVVPRPTDHINLALVRSLFVDPPRDEFLGADDRGARVVLGEAVLAAFLDFLPTTLSYAPERGLAVSYALLGDPATRVSIGRPLTRVLTNGSEPPAVGPLRLRTPGDTLRFDVRFVSNVRLDSIAVFRNTGSGDVVVPASDYVLTPAFPDTGIASVYGGRRFDLTWVTHPEARDAEHVFVSRDRNGLVRRSSVSLALDAVLRREGTPIADGDEVPADAALTLLVLSPRPIADPQLEFGLTLNGAAQPFAATPAPGDTSRREWVLQWVHAPYPIDRYDLTLSVLAGETVQRSFEVTATSSRLALKNVIPFPNPFDNSGMRFSFLLTGSEPADLRLTVLTLAGRPILSRTEFALAPGYHQVEWDGRDAEGDDLANGVYFYRLVARTAGGESSEQLGRLVKLRRPRRYEEPAVP